VTLIIPTKV